MDTRVKNIVVTCVMAAFFLILSGFAWLKPADAYSDSERRPLEQFPVVSTEEILSGGFMTDFETYTLDQFPLRDSFRNIKAISAFYVFGQKDNNDIYIADGYVSKMEYPMKTDSVKRVGERFRYVYDKYLADADTNVYFSVIPDKNYFLAEENGYLSMDYRTFIESLKAETDFMEYIDITGLLTIEDYYRTDTHWRQECITDVAVHLANKMGVILEAEYEENILDNPFYGVYYGQAALPLPGEELKYLTAEGMENCTIYDFQNSKNIGMYDFEKAGGKDPYEMFLSGPISLITIENPDASTDKELILFRDSFGSSIAPLFAEGYAKITLIDIRYLHPDMLERFVEFDGADVLFLYSTLVLNNAETIK